MEAIEQLMVKVSLSKVVRIPTAKELLGNGVMGHGALGA